MKRTPMRRRKPLRAKKQLRRSKPIQRTASMAASERQRAAVAGRTCIVCGADERIDPAHLIPRSLGGAATHCVSCRSAGDVTGPTTAAELDLLPYLEPAWRAVGAA
jgi:hypothetical protein